MKGTEVMKKTTPWQDIMDQIIGVHVMDPDGEVYMVTGSKRIHEMFEPYIKLLRISDNKEVYVSLDAYGHMCDIADEADILVRR